jgi:beta-phosphoglucomutase family hydrolase
MRFGLPSTVSACLFDLDGVLTPTAELHAAAWKGAFDPALAAWAARRGEALVPFDRDEFERYVDGRPRLEGVRCFLAARRVELPEGRPDDPPGAQTVYGVANRKTQVFDRMLRDDGMRAYEGSKRYVRAVRHGGLATAVVSSSTHCRAVLQSAGISTLFDAVMDGTLSQQEHLAGKPAPDTYLAAAGMLHADAHTSAVFEDAISGVEAGRAGGFGCVVGVDRAGHATELRDHGADVVVRDLGELLEVA